MSKLKVGLKAYFQMARWELFQATVYNKCNYRLAGFQADVVLSAL
jgi:hypothetical protein